MDDFHSRFRTKQTVDGQMSKKRGPLAHLCSMLREIANKVQTRQLIVRS